MEYRITIARPAEEVFAFLADPANIRHWLPQLRRDDARLPDSGLEAGRDSHRIAWRFEPPGCWAVTGAEGVAELSLTLDPTSLPAPDPTEPETVAERLANAAMAALHSVKSHIEAVSGGDPTLPMPDAPSRLYGHTATQEPEL